MSIKAKDGLFNDKLEVMGDLKVGGLTLNAQLAQGFVSCYWNFTPAKVFNLAANEELPVDLTGGVPAVYNNYPVSQQPTPYPALDQVNGYTLLAPEPADINCDVLVEVSLNLIAIANNNEPLVFTFGVDQPVGPSVFASGKLEVSTGTVGQGASISGWFINKNWVPGGYLGRLYVTAGPSGASFALDSVQFRVKRISPPPV